MMKRVIGVAVALGWMGLSAWAGVTFTAVSKHEGAAQSDPNAPKMDSTTKAWFDGGQGRMEFIQGTDNPMMPKGGYMLMKDAGKTMVMVDPAKKTYMKWDMESMMGMAGGAMGMMNMKVSNAKVEKLLEEAGPKMLGCPTRHFKFRTSYTMSMSFMGMNTTTAMDQEEELWTTDKYKDAGLEGWKNKLGMKTGDKGLDELVKAQMDKVQGVVLKMITVNTTKDSSGKSQVNRMTMEVTEIKEENVTKDKFEIPADYTEKQMADLMPGLDAMKRGGGGKPPKHRADEQNEE